MSVDEESFLNSLTGKGQRYYCHYMFSMLIKYKKTVHNVQLADLCKLILPSIYIIAFKNLKI